MSHKNFKINSRVLNQYNFNVKALISWINKFHLHFSRFIHGKTCRISIWCVLGCEQSENLVVTDKCAQPVAPSNVAEKHPTWRFMTKAWQAVWWITYSTSWWGRVSRTKIGCFYLKTLQSYVPLNLGIINASVYGNMVRLWHKLLLQFLMDCNETWYT